MYKSLTPSCHKRDNVNNRTCRNDAHLYFDILNNVDIFNENILSS